MHGGIVPTGSGSLKNTAPAQQTSTGSNQEPAPQAPAPNETKEAPKPQSGSEGQNVPGSTSNQGAVQGTSNDRLFYTLPNFLSLENAGNVPPPTTGQKFSVVARGSFDYVIYPWYGFLSAISQAENSEPGFGQGAEGVRQAIWVCFRRRDDRKLHYWRRAAFAPPARPALFSIGQRELHAQDRLRGEPNFCHTHRFRWAAVQLLRSCGQRFVGPQSLPIATIPRVDSLLHALGASLLVLIVPWSIRPVCGAHRSDTTR